MRSIFLGLAAVAFASDDCQVAEESTMLQLNNRKIAGTQQNEESTSASSSMKDLQRVTLNSNATQSSQEEWCTTGIRSSEEQYNSVCCAASCGRCIGGRTGGRCSRSPGGRGNCCAKWINGHRGRVCESPEDEGCKIPPPLWDEYQPQRPFNGLAAYIDSLAPEGAPPIGAWCAPPGDITAEVARCGGLCFAPQAGAVPWCQGVDFSGFVDWGRTPEECPQRHQVTSRRQCQDLATAAGHNFYNFGYCPQFRKNWCITLEECNPQPNLPPWQMFAAPGADDN